MNELSIRIQSIIDTYSDTAVVLDEEASKYHRLHQNGVMPGYPRNVFDARNKAVQEIEELIEEPGPKLKEIGYVLPSIYEQIEDMFGLTVGHKESHLNHNECIPVYVLEDEGNQMANKKPKIIEEISNKIYMGSTVISDRDAHRVIRIIAEGGERRVKKLYKSADIGTLPDNWPKQIVAAVLQLTPEELDYIRKGVASP